MNGARKERMFPAHGFRRLGKAQIANLDVANLSYEYVSRIKETKLVQAELILIVLSLFFVC
jgi:hypothetical protein